MHTQINLVQDLLGWERLESFLEPAVRQCIPSDLTSLLKGRQIVFGSGESKLVPIQGWTFKNKPEDTPLMTIQPLNEETTILAVDSSSIQIAETEEGAIYAIKTGITTAILGQILAHFKMGPILFYLSEDTLRHSELDHRIIKLVLLDSESAKRLIRIRVERAIQLELSHHFSGSILLVDGSLRSSIFEHRMHTLKKVVEDCSLYKNIIVGLSKSTKIRILDKIAQPLTKIRGPGFMDVDLIIKSLTRNTIGDSLLVKFGSSYTSPILRADISTAAGDRGRSLGKILGNDSLARGYPETLQLAHHISTFTTTEISCLKSHILNKYDVIELVSEDLRKKLLGSIPA
jgi:hypothetical protein